MTKTLAECSTRQRDLANMRERRRMMLINRGFDQLRNRLPLTNLTVADERAAASPSSQQRETKQRTARLTKVDILRLTIQYINQLRALLAGEQVQEARLQIACSLVGKVTAKRRHHSKTCANLINNRNKQQADRQQTGSKLKNDYKQTTSPIHNKSSDDLGQLRLNHGSGLVLEKASDETGNSVKSDACKHVIVTYRKCISGRSYLLSWSKSHELTELFLDDDDDNMSTIQLGQSQTRRVLRNTKLWIPKNS
jgi:hypothetical protein